MAVDIFSLTGKIAVDYSDAISGMDKVKESAKKTADSLDDVDDAAEDAGDSVEDAGDSAESADGQFTTWKATLANIASQAITTLISKCTELAKQIVELGTDTETAFAQLETIAGTENIDNLKESISELSKETGVSSSELALVAYNAISAGSSAEEAMDMVTAATKLGVAGFTDADSALSVLSTAMNSYGDSCGTAEEISDSLIQVQNLGVTTIGQLSSSMGKAIATGSAYSVNLGNLESAYVSITKAGISTEEATTYLNSMLNELGDSGSDVSAILQEQTGKSFTQLMEDGYSLGDVLGILYDACGDDSTALMNLWSSAEAGKASNAIVNQGLEAFNDNLETITNSSGATEDAYSTMADTMETKISKMKTNFEELGLKIFDGLEEPLTSAINFITDSVIPWLEKLIENFDKIAPVVAGVTAAFVAYKVAMGISSVIDTLTKATEGTTIAQAALNAVLNMNPFVLIVTLIAGLITALIVLWNTNDGFREAVTNAWEAIKSAFGTAIEAIKNFFSGLVEGISNALSSAWEFIKGILDSIVSGFQSLWNTVSNIFNTLVNALSTAWETIKNVVQVAIMFIVELISAAFDLITLPFRFIWENCRDTIMELWETIKTTVSNALDNIKTTISNVWNAIVSFLTPILNGIKNTFTTVWNAIKTAVSTVVNAVKSVIQTVFNAIKTYFTTVLNAYKTVFTTVFNAIKSVVTTVINAIKSVISTVFNAIKSTISTVLNSIKSTFSSVWNGIKSTVSNVINGVKSVISSGLNGAFSTVTNVLTNIKNKFTSIFDSAKNIVSNAINKIKGFFNFSWSLPKLKMPHISISGSFSLSPPSVPHFSIEWYKKAMEDGMIMNSPTIFGYDSESNKLLAGGEAGSETVVGTDNLMQMIAAAVSAENEALLEKFETLISLLAEYFPEILEGMNRAVVLDSGVLVGELAPGMDEELGNIARRKGR